MTMSSTMHPKRDHRDLARVWVVLSSIALALLFLAPGVALVLLVFPIFIEDPPNTMPAFRGVNTLFFTVVRSVLVCVVAALAANALILASLPAVIRAIKHCPTPGAARFGKISAIVFGVGLVFNAVIWGVVLGPWFLSLFPALQESARTLGSIGSKAFEKLSYFTYPLVLAPFVFDVVRFIAMLIAGIAVSTARHKSAVLPAVAPTAQAPR